MYGLLNHYHHQFKPRMLRLLAAWLAFFAFVVLGMVTILFVMVDTYQLAKVICK